MKPGAIVARCPNPPGHSIRLPEAVTAAHAVGNHTPTATGRCHSHRDDRPGPPSPGPLGGRVSTGASRDPPDRALAVTAFVTQENGKWGPLSAPSARCRPAGRRDVSPAQVAAATAALLDVLLFV